MKYTNKPNKIVLVPYPALGHVTPMLTLASALSNRGLEPVVVVPEFIHRRLSTPPGGGRIWCVPIPDGLEDGVAHDFFAIERSMENHMPLQLEYLVRKLNGEDHGGKRVVCIVVDLLASWAIGVGYQCGVRVAGFWPAMLSTYWLIADIPHMVRMGIISETGIPQYEAPICLESSQLTLSTEDLPWLIGTLASRHSRFKFWTRTLERSQTLKSLLVNTFPNESPEKLNYTPCDSPHIFPVGPFIKPLTCAKTGLKEDTSCLDWLDNQIVGSVIYISFGSWVSPIEERKVGSLAMALEALKRPFIWVLGSEWRKGLPSGYLERVKVNKGIVVSWAPQMEVLQHKAIGCYLTHCGWNSTVEAIKCEKKLLCYPIAGDQFVNCAYIVEVWRIGVRINGFAKKEVEECVKRVMEDEDMNDRLVRVKESVMGKDASLRVMDNLASFVDTLSQEIEN
ncbi:hypothetical protein LguiA_024311 [Lonicera macranthoides]